MHCFLHYSMYACIHEQYWHSLGVGFKYFEISLQINASLALQINLKLNVITKLILLRNSRNECIALLYH